MITELRYRAAVAVDRAMRALANSIDGATQSAAEKIENWTPWVRGYGRRISRRITPCGCEATNWACSRTRPPRPGSVFREPCDCPCHDRADYKREEP